VTLRHATPDDLPAISAIQAASPEAAQWSPMGDSAYRCWVAAAGDQILGFLCYREVAPGEHELLNLAVAPESRGAGVAQALLRELLSTRQGTWFLEVRESNEAALRLYQKLGFRATGRRPGYYRDSPESAIVMSFYS
jgi:ribosomal-protein-alanine N-acetyltransferase